MPCDQIVCSCRHGQGDASCSHDLVGGENFFRSMKWHYLSEMDMKRFMSKEGETGADLIHFRSASHKKHWKLHRFHAHSLMPQKEPSCASAATRHHYGEYLPEFGSLRALSRNGRFWPLPEARSAQSLPNASRDRFGACRPRTGGGKLYPRGALAYRGQHCP
jgi:hypothetical protein